MTVKRQVNIRTPARVLQYFTVSGYRQSSFGCFSVWSSAVENSSVSGRQKAQPYWKACDEIICIWSKVSNIKPFLIYVLKTSAITYNKLFWCFYEREKFSCISGPSRDHKTIQK
jgi:hypothetical protein